MRALGSTQQEEAVFVLVEQERHMSVQQLEALATWWREDFMHGFLPPVVPATCPGRARRRGGAELETS